MRIADSMFLKVWKVNNYNGQVSYDLGDSKKRMDGTYQNWTWFFCKPVGNAKNIQVNEGDVITIKSGLIEQYQKDGEYKNSVTIFDLEVTQRANNGVSQQNNGNNYYNPNKDPRHNGYQNQSNGNFEDDIPY